jgi:hypothetical protein
VTLVRSLGHSSLNIRYQFHVILTPPINSRCAGICRQEYIPFVHSQLNAVFLTWRSYFEFVQFLDSTSYHSHYFGKLRAVFSVNAITFSDTVVISA